jgi:hypothetical protein
MRRYLEFKGERIYFDDFFDQPTLVYLTRCELEALRYFDRRWRDRMHQDMNNNLWDNHPGELDRWADDGGPVGDV